MDSEGNEMSELNLHKAAILGENAGYNKEASILYPLCMKSGCFHCHTGHEWETALELQGRLCRQTKPARKRKKLKWLQKTVLANLAIYV